MFEFHGWAVIRADDGDDPAPDVQRQREDLAVARVNAEIGNVADGFSWLTVQRTGNGMIVLSAHGLRNHRWQPVFDIFQRIAADFPQSYGTLHVRDDEVTGFDESFQVWRLTQGRFMELPERLAMPAPLP